MTASNVSMDMDDMLEILDDDGNIREPRLLQRANIDENDYKGRHKILSSTINDDIQLNFKRNADLLERLDAKLNAQGDQGKLQSFFLKVLAIQRMSKHAMVLSQNEHRLKQRFKVSINNLRDVIDLVKKICGESNVQDAIMDAIQQFLSKGSKIKTNEITEGNIPDDLRENVEEHVELHLTVCVLHNNNNNILYILYFFFLSLSFSIYIYICS